MPTAGSRSICSILPAPAAMLEGEAEEELRRLLPQPAEILRSAALALHPPREQGCVVALGAVA
jgi:hypothetical protein